MYYRSLLAAVIFLALSTQAGAVGSLFVRPLNSSSTHANAEIRSYDAKVTIQDHVAETHVDQVFANTMGATVEATFIFPLPAGAVITDMYYWFNNVRYKASVRERKEAQAAYDAQIRRLIDPALLQEIGDNVFKLNIAPINPRSDVRVEITYTEFLPYDEGIVSYKHLLRTTGVSPVPLQRVSLLTTVTAASGIRSVTTSFANETMDRVERVNATSFRCTFGDENYVPTKDYTVRIRAERNGVDVGVLTYVPVEADSFGQDAFYATWVTSPDSNASVLPRSAVFVADVSSSMEGVRMEQLRTALMAFLDNLTSQDKFNIVFFSTNVVPFSTDVVDATSGNIEEARAFVRARSAKGLTNISGGLREALRMTYDEGRAKVVVFLTDGQPSWGELNEAAILDSMVAWNTQHVRLFPIGIGAEPSAGLLNGMARVTNGFVTMVASDDSIAVLAAQHIRRISLPYMSNLHLDYGTLDNYDIYPEILPDVYVGGRVLQVGRYRAGGLYPVTLTGSTSDVPFTIGNDVLFGDPARSNKAIARLWAREKINALIEEITRVGERKELVDAIIDLSIRFNILTKYTALYADPNDPGGQPTTVPGEHGERPIETLGLSVSPNPSSDVITATVTTTEHARGRRMRVTIHDALGRSVAVLYDDSVKNLITRLTWTVQTIEGGRAAAGLYYAVVEVDGNRTSASFIILP